MEQQKKDIEDLIERCFKELSEAYSSKYDGDKAEKTAAMFLAAQGQLSFLLGHADFKARHLKNEVERIEAVKYFEAKDDNSGKKMTEAMLTQYVAKNEDVINAKKTHAEAEADLKKYSYIMNSLKEGHIYFRNIGKSKVWE